MSGRDLVIAEVVERLRIGRSRGQLCPAAYAAATPSRALRRALSMRIGTFQRYRISPNSPKSWTKGTNARTSYHDI
jgi:hypothetical protein